MPIATTDEVASLEGLAMTQVTAEALKAGQPLYVGASGLLYLASAAAGLRRGIVDGFARTDAASGQPCQVEDHHLTLADWTAVTGSVSLVPGRRYFLDTPTGRLTASAPSGAGVFVIRVGVALNAQTLKIQIVDLSLVVAAQSTGDLAGAAPASATATGAPILVDALTGAAPSTAALSGAPTITAPDGSLAGAAPASAVASGTVSANDNLTGAGPASAVATGQASAIDALSGAAPASATGVATVTTSTPARNRVFAFGLMGATAAA